MKSLFPGNMLSQRSEKPTATVVNLALAAALARAEFVDVWAYVTSTLSGRDACLRRVWEDAEPL